MNSKKFLRMVSLVAVLAISLPAISAEAPKNPVQTATATANKEERATEMLQRLDVIKSMSKSELTRVEKRNLRKEVREIKKEMAVGNGGVYLSVGAVIIIILLLILIL